MRISTLQFIEFAYEDPRCRLASYDWAAALLSDGSDQGRFSYLIPQADRLIEASPNDEAQLQSALSHRPELEDAPHPLGPFSGGIVGMAAFELGLRLESLSPSRFRLAGGEEWPELVILHISAGLAFDHKSRRAFAFARESEAPRAKAKAKSLRDMYLQLPVPAPLALPLGQGPMLAETPPEVHGQKVTDLVQKIHAGELFQANLAQGWSGKLSSEATPHLLLQTLAYHGGAPYGALIRFGHRAVVSNSPERFIGCDPSGTLQTRPIKGTRKRGETADQDQILANELINSEKDIAENLMIVDLMRNDLARICVAGSIAVPQLCGLESFSNVHHLVSVVTGQLRPKVSLSDLLVATLPAGSVSGAPKVQAMKVISQMEAPRGPYCGIVFYQDVGGGFDSSVLIRTLALQQTPEGWIYRCAAGGGIVADSDAADETAETLTKISLIQSVIQ